MYNYLADEQTSESDWVNLGYIIYEDGSTQQANYTCDYDCLIDDLYSKKIWKNRFTREDCEQVCCDSRECPNTKPGDGSCCLSMLSTSEGNQEVRSCMSEGVISSIFSRDAIEAYKQSTTNNLTIST